MPLINQTKTSVFCVWFIPGQVHCLHSGLPIQYLLSCNTLFGIVTSVRQDYLRLTVSNFFKY